MSGLLDLILQGPSAAEKAFGILSMLPQSGPATPGPGRVRPAGVGGSPVGNISIGDALLPNDPSLVSRHGEELQRAAMRTLRGEGILPHVTSSYRTPQEQAALYASKPGLAAPPGQSLHQQGLAIDVDSGWLAANPDVRRYLLANNWFQFDPQLEPWHFSYGTTG